MPAYRDKHAASTGKARPPRRGPRETLAALFGSREMRGVVAPAPAVPLRGILRYFWPYLGPYKARLIFTLVLVVIVPAISAASVYMIKVVVDEVITPADLGPFAWIGPIVLGLAIARMLVQMVTSYVMAFVVQRFLLDVRTGLYRHLQGLSLDFFERRKHGDTLTRLVTDVDAIARLALSAPIDLLSAVVTLVYFVAVMLWLDWQLTLITLGIALIIAVIWPTFTRRIKVASRESRRRTGTLAAVAEDALSGVALVQAYNRQELEQRRYDRESRGVFEAIMLNARLRAVFVPMIGLINTLAALAVVLFGTMAIESGRLTTGGLIAFVAYLSQMFSPLQGIAQIITTIFQASASAERVIELFEVKPTIVDAPHARELPRAEGAVAFESVSFRYPGAPKLALDGVSFSASPGETIALVGHSGAGKSTIAKLLLRFYDPEGGAVLLDGHDLKDLKMRTVRDNIAVLLQENLLLDGTVRNNILYGKPDATDEEIVAAAQAAEAHDFIIELPQGYDTEVGQKGRLLSGGQRQRVAIARAMIRDAPVLVLDEPTTGLDIESGNKIVRPLNRLMTGRTTVVISHNLLTVRTATRIVVLEQGRVVEEGTHDELMALEGTYHRLYLLHELTDAVAQDELDETVAPQ